jgi:hypothetical protein
MRSASKDANRGWVFAACSGRLRGDLDGGVGETDLAQIAERERLLIAAVPEGFSGLQLLGVALRAQPRHAPVSIHPVVRVGLAGQAGDFAGLDARIVRLDFPVLVCVSDNLEGHFCFCHAALWR